MASIARLLALVLAAAALEGADAARLSALDDDSHAIREEVSLRPVSRRPQPHPTRKKLDHKSVLLLLLLSLLLLLMRRGRAAPCSRISAACQQSTPPRTWRPQRPQTCAPTPCAPPTRAPSAPSLARTSGPASSCECERSARRRDDPSAYPKRTQHWQCNRAAAPLHRPQVARPRHLGRRRAGSGLCRHHPRQHHGAYHGVLPEQRRRRQHFCLHHRAQRQRGERNKPSPCAPTLHTAHIQS